jgi:hypothetical protein
MISASDFREGASRMGLGFIDADIAEFLKYIMLFIFALWLKFFFESGESVGFREVFVRGPSHDLASSLANPASTSSSTSPSPNSLSDTSSTRKPNQSSILSFFQRKKPANDKTGKNNANN